MSSRIPISSDSYASINANTKRLKDCLIGTNVDGHNGWLSRLDDYLPEQKIRRNLFGNGLTTSPSSIGNILGEPHGLRYSIQNSIAETPTSDLNGRCSVHVTVTEVHVTELVHATIGSPPAPGGDYNSNNKMEKERNR